MPQEIEKNEIKQTDAIRFTDREAVRLIAEEAERTGETLAKVAARVIVKYFTLQQHEAERQAARSAA